MSHAYYNEFDPFAAAWLRELIKDGLIAPGDVDERSIADVAADDLKGYTQAHFFAGIGGWSHALRLAGWDDARPVWTGSCPCQPFSGAGKRQGTADARHLWPEFHRLIAERRPVRVFGEQVESAVGHGWLDGVFTDLEAEGYACGAVVLGAHSVGAPHIRQRLWWVADAGRAGDEPGCRPGTPHGTVGAAQGEARERERRGLAARDRGAVDSRLADADGVGPLDEQQPADGRGTKAVAECGGNGRLADADGGLAGDGGLQPGGEHRQQPQDGGVGERLEHAQSDGRIERRTVAGERGAGGGRGDGGVGQPVESGLEGHAGHGDDGHQPGRIDALEARPAPAPGDAGFWSDAEWIACSDGKARRVEPGIQPLATGILNRVGLLRGAGNAIVPQVAATFIRAASGALT